jgi:hypothetical protein
VALIILPVALVWGYLYWPVGEHEVALTPWAYATGSARQLRPDLRRPQHRRHRVRGRRRLHALSSRLDAREVVELLAHAPARLAFEMRERAKNCLPEGTEHRLRLRIGISSGPVVAGVTAGSSTTSGATP